MTDKEKAQAYDEAKERMRAFLKEWENCGAYGEAMEKARSVFPEFAESEDEKMINELQGFLDSFGADYFGTGEWQKFHDWLEMQKYDRMQPIYDNQESFESALDKAWKSYNDSGARTVDGCEDNYIECAHAKGFREGYLFGLEKQKDLDKMTLDKMIVVSPEVWDNAISDAYENGKKDGEKQKEQKPAWSEEDEKNLELVTDCIYEFYPDPVMKYKLKDWLKFLPERFNLQPKAELTLLDENIIKAAVAFVEQNNHFNYWGGIDKHTVINALRSLRPSWKPTEEQMEAFKKYIEEFQARAEAAVGGWNNFDVMIRLYEQLKKL